MRSLLAHCVSQNQRAFFVIIGDRGREQLVNLNFMLTKLSPQKRGPVLWCYKKELGFKTHNKSRKRELKKRINSGQYDPNVEDPFELFTASTDIRYTYYKDSESVLGKTFTMAVLQDFEALTPNILCRTVETVGTCLQLFDVCLQLFDSMPAFGKKIGVFGNRGMLCVNVSRWWGIVVTVCSPCLSISSVRYPHPTCLGK